MTILDFVTTLFLQPVELPYIWLAVSAMALVTAGWVLAWFIAFFHAKYAREWRTLLSTTSRLKISWAWGWCVVACALLFNLFQLVYRARVPSLLAAMPYLVAVPACLLIASMLRHSVRSEVQRFQKLVQGR